MPRTQFAARIGDVDGDGRPDTEWAVERLGGTIEFGVTTAAGATVSRAVGFASGGQRTVSIGTLGTGQTVALPTDGHAAELYVLRGCRWISPKSAHTRAAFSFTTGYYDPPEEGGGCIGRRLYQVDSTASSSYHYAVTGITETISRNGREVTPGRRVTFATDKTGTSLSKLRSLYGDGQCGYSKRLLPIHKP